MLSTLRNAAGKLWHRPGRWNRHRQAELVDIRQADQHVVVKIRPPERREYDRLLLTFRNSPGQIEFTPTARDGSVLEFHVDLTATRGHAEQFPAALDVSLIESSPAINARAKQWRRAIVMTGSARRKVEQLGFQPVGDDLIAWVFDTNTGTLALRLSAPREPWVSSNLERYTRTPTGPVLDVRVTANYSHIESIEVEVTQQEGLGSYHIDHRELDTEVDTRHRKVKRRIRLAIDLEKLVEQGLPLDEDSLTPTIWVQLKGLDEPMRSRIRLDPKVSARMLKHVAYRRGETAHVLIPYLSLKARRLAFTREVFQARDFTLLKRLIAVRWLLRPLRPVLGIWLVGERPYKAQENGLQFFRWVRQHHPNKRCYYVITAESPERGNVDPLGNVVLMRSREHIWRTMLASRIIGTHHGEYLMASRLPQAVRATNAVQVFMQHGVMGMKNLISYYGRFAPEFHADRFLVSSEREREMIVNDFRFRPGQVFVTGLSRFDTLFAPADQPPDGLLIIPTWRDWISDEVAFHESRFKQRWTELLNHPKLAACIDDGLKVSLILHPNMRQFVDYFRDLPGVQGRMTVIQQGEVDVQTLLRSHQALLTDYSSVGFDFSFQNRPVFYFQFDRDRYIGWRPSHLDPVADLPGYVETELDDIAGLIADSYADGFEQSPELRRRADVYIAHRDRESSVRIFDVASRRATPATYAHRLVDSPRHQARVKKFRRSRAYHPAMRAVMTVARALPRNGTVVFDSANGAAYNDSPRAIYEELVSRPNHPTTMWSTRSTFRPIDISTRKIEPESLPYYWHLGRASAWVNNQSFPIDVRPARRTFYLQTWHGTPLKRMQHDAISTVGRAPGYLDRVSRMMSAWSALLSPSPWASERFRSAFQFTGPILETGYPRNDALARLDRHAVDLTRRRIGLPHGARAVLYAPTFRDDFKVHGRFAWRDAIDWPEFLDALPEDLVVLVRRHQIVRGGPVIPPEYAHRVIDVSTYPDSQDLLALVDALITDYSSIFFDYSITDRPIIFYCHDYEHYTSELRGLYLDFEEVAPGPIVRTWQELAAELSDLQGVHERFEERLERVRRQFCPLDDGHAAARACDALLAGGGF